MISKIYTSTLRGWIRLALSCLGAALRPEVCRRSWLVLLGPLFLFAWLIPSAQASYLPVAAGGNIGIGTTTASEKLEVIGTVKATAFIGNGAGLSGLTSSQWTTVTGGIYYNSGNVGIGTSAPLNSSRLDVQGGAAATSKIVNINGTFADLGGSRTGLYVDVTAGTTGVGSPIGSWSEVRTTANAGTYANAVVGAYGEALHSGNATADFLIGMEAIANQYGAGAVTNAYGLYPEVWKGDGTVTNAFGLYYQGVPNINPDTLSGAGTVINQYGIAINKLTQATTRNIGILLDDAVPGAASVGNFAILEESGYASSFSGNIGIGTTNPEAKLALYNAGSADIVDAHTNADVTGAYANESRYSVGQAGANRAAPSDVQRFRFFSGHGTFQEVVKVAVTTPSVDTGTVLGAMDFYTQGVGGLLKRFSVTDTMAAFQNVNVGIGSTVPQQKVEVVGTVKATAFIGDGSGLSNISGSVSGLNTGYLSKSSSATTINDSAIYQNGTNIGIGSTGPGHKLEVAGQAYATGTIGSHVYFYTDVAGAADFLLASSGGSWGAVQNDAAGDWSLAYKAAFDATLGTPVLTWTSGGLVGIGSTVPQAKLDVEGSAYFGNGNVGIGTTSPGTPLEIASSNDAILRLRQAGGGWNYIEFYDDTSRRGYFGMNGSNNMLFAPGNAVAITMLTNGYVGIGTTVPQATLDVEGSAYFGNGNIGVGSSAPSQKIDVVGTVKATAFLGDGSGLSNISGSVSGLNAGYISKSSSATTINDSAIYQNGSNIGIGSTAPAQKLDVLGNVYVNGNIGIGSTNPNYLLTVGSSSPFTVANTGNATVNGILTIQSAPATDVKSLVLTGSGVKSIDITDTASHLQMYSSTGAENLPGLYGSSNLAFGAGSNNAVVSPSGVKMVILSGGNVGINSTMPQAKLDVEGSVYVGNGNIGVGSSAPAQKLDVVGNAYFNGNVGIGTTDPTSALFVKGAVRVNTQGITTLPASFFEGNYTYNLGADAVGSNRFNIYRQSSETRLVNSSGGFYFSTDATSHFQFYISSGGNVGIGTTVPQATLDVEGSAYFGNGNIGVGSTVPAQKVDVLGTVKATAFIGDGSGLSNISGSVSGLNAGYISKSSSATTINDSAIYQNGSNIGIGSTAPAQKLDVLGNVYVNGNVGIGTTAPSQKLDVQSGNINTSGNLTAGGNIYSNSSSGYIGIGNAGPYINMFYDNPTGFSGFGFNLYYNGTNYVYVNTAGWSGTGQILSLNPSSGLLFQRATNGVNPAVLNTLFSIGTTGNASVVGNLAVAGTGNTTIAGNVGIGSSAPQAKLDVEGNVYVGNGNVGIGTTTPLAKLDVSGKIALDGVTVAYRPTSFTGTLILGNGGTSLSHTTEEEGYNNTFVGLNAGINNTTGYYNTANGADALYANTTGYYNTANGTGALYNTTGSYNIASGMYALFANTTGSFNTASGYLAGRYIADGSTANTTSDFSLYLGANTKALADNDQNEIVIGNNATGVGSNSVVLGNSSITTTALKGNIGIGSIAPQAKLDVEGSAYFGNGNIGVGSSAPSQKIEVLGTVKATAFIGDGSGLSNISGSVSGLNTGYISKSSSATTINDSTIYQNGSNIGIGTTNPGYLITLAPPSNAIASMGMLSTGGSGGYLSFGHDGTYNAMIGYHQSISDAFEFRTGGLASANDAMVILSNGNIGIGTTNPLQTLDIKAGGAYGYNGVAMAQASTTLYNYFFGGAGNLTATGNYNTGLGYDALLNLTTGTTNIAIGDWALLNNTTGDSNVAIGYSAMQGGASNDSSNNIAIGYQAGGNLNGGNNSVLIGWGAGNNLTTGSGNIIFGYNISAPAVDTSNFLNIGNTIYGNLSTGNVGIGSSVPSQKLDVIGTVKATAFIGDGSGLTGIIGGSSQWTTNGTSIYYNTGNVGIGSSVPTDVLEIRVTNSKDGMRIIDIGSGDGINLQGYYPAINFNQYWNGSNQIAIGPDYTGAINLVPDTGDMEFDVGDKPGAGAVTALNPRFWIKNNGNIGISSTGPAARLDLVGNGTTSATPAVMIRDSAKVVKVTVLDNGNVGIGTAQPKAALEVYQGNILVGESTQGASSGFSIAVGSANQINAYASAAIGQEVTVSGNHSLAAGWGIINSGDTSIAFGNLISVTANHAIGMGQAVEATAINTVAIGEYVKATGINSYVIGEGTDSYMINNIASSLMIGFNSNIPTLFVGPSSGNGTTGNIGIGTTAPQARLDVEGSAYFGNGNIGVGTSAPVQKVEVVGTVKATAFIGDGSGLTGLPASGGWTASGTNVYTTTSSNNVGIGTSVPLARLDLVGAGTTSATTSLVIRDSTKAATVTVLDNGNVGIATTNPQKLLHVVGSLSQGISRFERTTAVTTGTGNDMQSELTTTGGQMTDGFGVVNGFYVKDVDNVDNQIADFGAMRDGADNSGALIFGTYTAGVHNIRMTIKTGGNVGIGSTVPSQALDVVGTVKATAFIGDGSGLTGLPASGGWTASGTNVYTTTSSNNVGIGTSVPLARLDLVGAGTTSATTSLVIRDSTKAAKMTVLDNGNVGIGVSAPSYNLDIVSAYSQLRLQSTTNSNSSKILHSAKAIDGSTVEYSEGISTGASLSDSSWYVGSGGPEVIRFVINYGTGNIGIGSTAPQAKLDVEGSAYFGNGNIGVGSSAPSQKVDVIGTVKATAFIGDGSGLTGLSAAVGWTRTGTNVYVTTSTDNVGIGTSVPQYSLDIKRSGSAYLRVGSTDTNVILGAIDVAYGWVGTGSNDPFTIGTNGGRSATFLTNGNVGINSDAPQAKLDVEGSAYFGNGNIGVGSSAPSQKIDVLGTVKATAFIGDGSGLTGLGAAGGWSASGTNVYMTTSTNNAGIGTSVPRAKLEVAGNVYVSSGNIGIGTTAPLSKLELVGAGATSATASLIIRDSALAVKVTVLDVGNMGIGSTVPQQKVDVVGTVKATAFVGDGSGITGITGTISGLNTGYISKSSSATGINDSAIYQNVSNIGIGTTAPAGKLVVYGGNVGVGSTAPRSAMDVIGTVTATAFVGDGSGLTGLATAGGWTRTGTNVYVTTSTDNVGIGSSVPRTKLDVQGTGYFNGNIGIGSTAPLAKIELVGAGATSATASLIIRDSALAVKVTVLDVGNMGIGSTVPQQKLDVVGTVKATAFIGDGSGITGITGTISGLNTGYISKSSSATGINDSAIYQNVSNIGIGTTAPAGKLVVYGGNVGVGTTAPRSAVDVIGTVTATAFVGDGSGLTGLATAGGWTRTGTNVYVTTSTDNVGIGSSVPRTKLDVQGTGYFNGNIGIGSTAPLAKIELVGAGATSATASLIIRDSALAVKVTVLDVGNMGIGSTVPQQKLDVVGTVKATAFVGDGSGITGITGTISGLNTGYISKSSSATGINDSAIYQNVSNIGIGSTVPQAKLDVEGSVYFGNGNIGVGSSAPSQKIDVIGTVKATAFIGDGSGISGITGVISGLTPGYHTKASSATTIGNSLIYDNGTNVGIGSTVPQAKLDLEGSAYFGNGNVGIGTTVPSELFDNYGKARVFGHFSVGAEGGVDKNYPSTANVQRTLIDSRETVTDMTTPSFMNGLYSRMNLNPSVNATASVYGLNFEIWTNSGNVRNVPTITATYNDIVHNGTGTLTYVNAIENYIYNKAAGNITSLFGVYNEFHSDGAGTIGDAYGVYTVMSRTAGTVTNAYGEYIGDLTAFGSSSYGLYLEDQATAGANKFAIYSAGGKSYHAGNLGIGSSAPQAKLDVEGSVYVGNGNVGIGTSVPQGKVHAYSSWNEIISDTNNGNYAGFSLFNAGSRRWVIAKETTAETGSNVGSNFQIISYGDNGFAIGPALTIYRSSGNVTFYYNVGVGSSVPTQKLDVIGTVKATAFIGDGSGLTGLPSGGGGGWSRSGTNVYVTTLTDNVGIGTSTPNAKLAVYGGNVGIGTTNTSFDLSFGGEAGRSIGVEENPYWLGMGLTVKAGNAATGSTDGLGGALVLKGGDSTGLGFSVIRFLTATAGASGTDTRTSSEVMRIKGPKVGIGTDSPGSYLSVAGGVSIGTTYATLAAPTDGVIVSGNVGIGTVTPGQKLEVESDSSYVVTAFPLKLTNANSAIGSGAGILFHTGDGDNARGKGGIVYAYGTQSSWNRGDFYIIQNSAGDATNPTLADAVMTVTNAGNVGIGTAVPLSKLDLVGAGATSATTSLVIRDSTKTATFAVLDNGNVGIGTSVPQAKLEAAFTDSTANKRYTRGLYSRLTYNGALSSGSDFYVEGDDSRPTVSSALSNGAYVDIYGVYALPTFSGSTSGSGGNEVNNYGISANPIFSGSIGGASDTVTDYAVYGSDVSSLGTTGTTTKYGGYFGVLGTADTNYAVYASSSGATINYGVYSASGTNYFSGNVGIGTTGPVAKLDARYDATSFTDPRSNINYAAKIVNANTSAWMGGLEIVGGGNQNYGSPILTVGDYAGSSTMNVNDGSVLISNGGSPSANPAGILEVTAGYAYGGVGGIVASNYSGYGSAAAQFTAKSSNGDFNMGLMANGASNDAYITNTLNAAITFGTNNTERMRISAGGNVGIGSSNPGQALDVNGTIRQSTCKTAGTLSANTSGDIICTSDERLKDIYGSYQGGLAALSAVQPIRFSYKGESFVHVGFSAQNVKSVLPEASALQDNGYWSLDDTAITALTVNAIKELKAENDSLKAENARQQGEINEQKKENTAILERLSVFEALRALVCRDHPREPVCRDKTSSAGPPATPFSSVPISKEKIRRD